MKAEEIKQYLKDGSYNDIFVPEFTWGDLRIDAIKIDMKHRWIRGYEIKVSKQDFDKDNKWSEYSEFCSSLCVVCPEGLIQRDEIEKPFGLIWINDIKKNPWDATKLTYVRKPLNFQKRNSLSWLYTYNRVLELEMRRMYFEMETLKVNNKYGR